MPEPPPDLAVDALRDFYAPQKFLTGMSGRHLDGGTRAYEWWPSQAKLAAAIQQQRKIGKPVRIVGLKARRVGWSLGACAELFQRTAFLPGQSSWVFTHVYSSNADLWGYFEQFDKTYAGKVKKLDLARKLRPSQSSAGRLEWAGDSYVQTGTAGNVDVGRSLSIRHLLLDEYAFYRDAPGLTTGVLQCVPDDPDTSIIVLSTANGVGGPFYDIWARASDPTTRGDWLAVFFAWWEHPLYQRTVEDPVAFQRSLTDEEHTLRQLYGLRPEQLAWRRWAIVNKCEGNVQRFHQEYPSNPEEAFIASGRPRFDLTALARQPIVREWISGELERQRIGTRTVPVFNARADGKGALRVLRRPQAGHRYVIGADPAQGIDVGEELGSSNPDFSVGCVLEADTAEQVAIVRERITPAVFGEYLVALGEWYNWAFLVPEAVDPSLVQEILRLQYPLHLIYMRQRPPDDRSTPPLHHVGFKTSTVTRPNLISGLDRALLDGSLIVRDPVTQQELHTFKYKASGRAEHETGCHDDCVMALALAVLGLQSMPRLPKDVASKPKPFSHYGISL